MGTLRTAGYILLALFFWPFLLVFSDWRLRMREIGERRPYWRVRPFRAAGWLAVAVMMQAFYLWFPVFLVAWVTGVPDHPAVQPRRWLPDPRVDRGALEEIRHKTEGRENTVIEEPETPAQRLERRIDEAASALWTGRVADALRLAEAGEKDYPRESRFPGLKAIAQFRWGKAKDALESVDRALVLLPDDAKQGEHRYYRKEWRQLRGRILLRLDRPADAFQDFKEAYAISDSLQIPPDETPLYFQGLALQKLKRWKEAEDKYKEVLKPRDLLNGRDPLPTLRLAEVYRATKREAEAKRILKDLDAARVWATMPGGVRTGFYEDEPTFTEADLEKAFLEWNTVRILEIDRIEEAMRQAEKRR